MRLPSLSILRQVFRPKILLGAGLALAVSILFTRLTVIVLVDRRAEDMLTAAQEDFVRTYYSTIDYSMGFAANAIIDELRTVTPLGRDEMRRLARVYAVDEINLADTNGVWVASSEEGVVGKRLSDSPCTAEFLHLIAPTSTQLRIYQKFRSSVSHPDQRRKYVGMIFDDHSGILQLGLDAQRVALDFERTYSDYAKDWFCGKDDVRYFIIAREDGTIVGCGRRQPTDAKTLAEIGYDPKVLPSDPSQTTFRQTLFGEKCRCREFRYVNFRFITVLPDDYFDEFLHYAIFLSRGIFALVLVFVGLIYYNSECRRIELNSRNAEVAARRKADLLMARAIQKPALPAVFPPYPRDFMMDLYAQMEPAKSVGGDFYDFQYVGNDRLAFLVADVSGKGVPAAMFMMKAKTILQALTLSVADLSDALAAVNEHLCEGNEADMFVTCWVGVLDEHTGLLRYVNAGHNPPCVCRAETGTVETLAEVSGLFLGGMTNQRYKTFETHLKPGDLLFLYTDGVTEAHNAFNEMFGEARMEEVLRGERGLGLARFMSKRALPSPKTVCTRMRAAVDAFAGKEPQFDDITMLALRYRGLPETDTLTVPAEGASVPKLNAFAEATLVRADCPQDVKADLLVALDEMASNVASYSGATTMTLTVETATNPAVARFHLSDDGTPWNPLDHLDPDVTLSADEREIGGLGILMVKKLMDDVSYVRRDGKNHFIVRKLFKAGGDAA